MSRHNINKHTEHESLTLEYHVIRREFIMKYLYFTIIICNFIKLGKMI